MIDLAHRQRTNRNHVDFGVSMKNDWKRTFAWES
jgi:hypothetical protein